MPFSHPETLTALKLIFITFLVHCIDYVQTYCGIKWKKGYEANPLVRLVTDSLGVVTGLIYLTFLLGMAAFYAIISALYSDYYHWWSATVLPYTVIVFLILSGGMAIKITIVVSNFVILIFPPKKLHLPPLLIKNSASSTPLDSDTIRI